MRQAKRADIATGKESADQVTARDRQVQVRRVRFIVMDGDSRWARAAQMIARQRLQGIHGRLVVGALDANRNALAGLEQPRRGHYRNL